MFHIYHILLFSLIGSLSFSSYAKPNILADFGGESAVRFYESLQPVHSEDAPSHPHAILPEISEAQLLPIISHRWKIGSVKTQKISLPGALPIFLIGEDQFSENWIKKYRHQLSTLQAFGLVINVSTPENLQYIRQLAPELTFMPVVADELAERTGIQHYPVLLTSEYIIQSLEDLKHYE